MSYYPSSATRRIALFAGVGLAALTASAPAFAQTEQATEANTPADPNCVDENADGVCDTPASADGSTAGGIVVTGSRIRRPELESTVPVTNFGGDQIYKQSEHNLGEALNDLPALRSTFSQSNAGSGIGVAGLNLLDLRGLGVERTLVLVDGRRHVPSDLQNSASSVDINTIPTDLVERVDIVTGGNSAVYGSDAIAGVVNFILKKDFEGFNIRGGAGIPGYGAGANYFGSAVIGKNFADGRGNIAASAEYTRQERLFASQVPWRRASPVFLTTNVDPDGSRSDGIPDSTLITRDVRGATIATTGLVAFPQNVARSECGGESLLGEPYNCDFIFQGDGTLVPVTFDGRTGTSAFASYIGGNAETGNEGQQVSVYPFSERYIGNILGRYQFSDAFEVFLEGKYARVKSIGANSGAAFNQGQFITFNDARSQIRLDNPFLRQQARDLITSELLASGNNNGLISVFGPLTAGDLAAIDDGSYRFAIAKSFDDLGIRDEDTTRETYRAVVGARGQFSPTWSYEIAANYGRTNEDVKVLGNVNVQRLFLALDAGINPATGQIQCRAQFDPDAQGVSDDVDPDGGAATIAADIAACVPYNPFGTPDNRAARDYIVSNAGSRGHLEQINVAAFVSGDTTGFFELPGGPISVALGAEYRREDAFFEADDIINQGLTFLNSLQTFDPDPTEVKEAFGELEVPLLADRPFFDELTLSGAVRVSDYNNATGTVWAYNFGGRYSPVSDITFRANYGRSVRAPNYRETQDPLSQDFAPGFADPCATIRLSQGTSSRQAACQADLGAALAPGSGFQNKVAGVYSLEILSGGNELLTEERGTSLTIGAVVQPRWVPGLAVTFDYYDIKVDNVIAFPGAQTIVNNCYDLPAGNQFCDLFDRYTGAGPGPNGEVTGEILVGSLIDGPVNFARRERRGIDVDVSYRRQLSENTFVNARLYYTHNFKISNFEDPTNAEFENRLLSELGDPKDEFVFDVDFTFGQFTLGYGAHYIGPMYVGSYENYFPLNGEPALDPDAFDINEFPEVLYHDLRAAWQVGGTEGNRPFEFYVGVDNVFDKTPPLSATGLTVNSAIYDVWGRRFYTGFKASF